MGRSVLFDLDEIDFISSASALGAGAREDLRSLVCKHEGLFKEDVAGFADSNDCGEEIDGWSLHGCSVVEGRAD